jgi:hypothetical protein
VFPVFTVRRAGTYIGSSPSLGSLTARRSSSVHGCRRHRYQTIARRFVGRFLQVQRRDNRAIRNAVPAQFRTVHACRCCSRSISILWVCAPAVEGHRSGRIVGFADDRIAFATVGEPSRRRCICSYAATTRAPLASSCAFRINTHLIEVSSISSYNCLPSRWVGANVAVRATY